MALNEEEQWQQINYPTFFEALGDKITATKTALAAIPAETWAEDDHIAWLETNLNQVPIFWYELDGNYTKIRVGVRDSDQKPMIEITVPTMWLAD